MLHAAMSGSEIAAPFGEDGTLRLCDFDLVGRVAAGSQEALVETYRRHAAYVHGVAVRVAGPGVLAEEVTQDVFLALWRQPERFDPSRSSLRGYLAMMASRRAIDRLRSEAARRRREETVADGDPSVRSPVLESELVATALDLREALASLTDEER